MAAHQGGDSEHPAIARHEGLRLPQLGALGRAVADLMDQVTVMLARLLAVAGELGGAGRAVHAPEPVRLLRHRRLVLHERLGRPLQLQEQIAEKLPGRDERSRRHHVLLGPIFVVRRRPQRRERLRILAFGPQAHAVATFAWTSVCSAQ